MTLLILIAVAFGGIALGWLIAFRGRPGLGWITAAAVILTSLWMRPLLEGEPWEPSLPLGGWILVAFLLAFMLSFGAPPIRCRLVTPILLRAAAPLLPRMSETEQVALEAGTVWFDGDLFSGDPDWERWLQEPPYRLTEEEQAFLDGPVEELCAMVSDWETVEHTDLPSEAWEFIKRHRFWGMIIPREHGGLGFSAAAHSAVIAKLSSRSTALAVTVMVPNSLGPAELLLHYGTDAQKRHYLPRLARGEEIPCFALTEPNAGSDAGGMRSRGIVMRRVIDGREVLGMSLTWDKRYITLAPAATLIGLAFKLYDPDHLLGERAELGITCALIPADTPGVQIGRRHDPLHVPFLNGPTTGKNVFVPLDAIIGGPAMAGQGWRMLMQSLSAGRGISLPSLAAGASQLATRTVGAYATIREQFHLPIGRFEGIQEVLARIGGSTYWIDAVRKVTASAVDAGHRPSVVSAIAKCYATEAMRDVINDAMDVAGGSGICEGPKNILARTYTSLPIGITVEGANILTRTMIIFGQGALRCHPHARHEVQAAREQDVETFDRHFFGHVGFVFTNLARAPLLAWSDGRLIRTPRRKAVLDAKGADEATDADNTQGDSRGDAPSGAHLVRGNALAREYQRLTRMSTAFALAADFAMGTLGGTLKRREQLTGRLADAVSWLYIGSAVLKRFDDEGRRADHLPYAQWAMQEALHRIELALVGFIANLPSRPAAWILRAAIFPIGARRHHGPDDRLARIVGRGILEGGSAHRTLTADVFLPPATELGLGQLEDALIKVIAARKGEQALRAAIRAGTLAASPSATLIERALAAGVIDSQERVLLESAALARAMAIAVDSFSPEEMRAPRTASLDAARARNDVDARRRSTGS